MSGRLREGPPLYSNIAESVAVPLIERITGIAFDQYVKEAILDPLGMYASGYSVEQAGEAIATGHQAIHNEDGIDEHLLKLKHPYDGLGGTFGMASSRLITTIEDMVCFSAYTSERLLSSPSC